ncbi:MAG: Asp-tRNA(Asn)/Glu-tRNA(Gln) amidotransferase subunit GatA [Spirochaetes bacterium]|nr:Asp-tRNA(Asn)/Glu-tRNA(Gln) amidotransferase subunit GatA [Spirochaetota bacterium]
MSLISEKNAKEIVTLVNEKSLSCEELLNDCFSQIEKYDPVLESFISLYDKETLVKEARESDSRRSKNAQLSAIDGIPLAVKDNIHSQGIPTTCASRILENYNPPYDATAVSLIKNSGGIILGKTNMDEFAMGSTCEHSSMCHTRNPWDIHRVPGGSSGGSAVAVSAGMTPFALGSDTGGSIRQPAAFCGVTGLKPTYGLVSRYGLVAYASSLDQIGPMSRDVYGNALLLNIISGYDVNDSTSLNHEKTDYTAKLGQDIKGKRIAVFRELLKEGISPQVMREFEKSLKVLKEQGALIEEVSFEAVRYVIAAYYFIACAEACSNLSRYDGVKYGFRSGKQTDYQEMLFTTRSYGFGKEVKKRILLGNFVLSSGYYDEYYRKAQKVRTLIRDELKKIFETADVIAMPTTPDIAFKHGESSLDPMRMYLSDITTVIPNLSGLPAISIPCGMADGMPVGLQFIGKPLDEQMLLQAASIYESSRKEKYIPELDHILDENVPGKPHSDSQKKDVSVKASVYTMKDVKKISETYSERTSKKSRVYCRDLDSKEGKKVTLGGWIHSKRNLGGIDFYILRDKTGFTQLVLEGEKPIEKLNLETVVEVYGRVTKEKRSPYRNIEIKVEKLDILGHAESSLPLNINSSLENINLPTILDNRTVSVRNPEIQSVFRLQSKIVKHFSDYLRDNDFTEIKTPKIVSSGAEGGTNIFELKYFDRSAYLAQSPQFYKQIMVGSGMERVFEVGPVFRAEHHDTVRHLNEYTSMDFEMGFIENEQDVIDMQEALIKYIFKNLKNDFKGDAGYKNMSFDVPKKFPRIHFLEAMEILSSLGVRDMEEGDISPAGEKALCDYFEEKENSSFVYVVGYPVKKRPMYTMPDERLPGYTRSFDLLYKGIEITTGGQRIHDYHQLRDNIVDFGFNPREFKDYLDIFKYGMTPHGGLGMGLERLTMKIMNLKNIREAALFPRDINRLTP